MTQVQALAARAISSGKKRYILTLMDPLGQETLAVYDSITNPGPLVGGFVSHRYANNTCGTLNFEARPDSLIGGDPRNICKLEYDTGESVEPIHYGVLTINPDPNRKNRGEYQSVSGKELLKNSPIPDTFDVNFGSEVDGAVWLRLLASSCKHKALKYNADLIPLTGQMFAGSMDDAAGSNLYDVFKAITSGCSSIGDDDWGVDPNGYIVVRPATGTVVLDYDRVTREFLTGDIYSEEACTSARIKLANRPSEGIITGAAYKPRLVAYVYSDPSHPAYEAPRDFKLPTKNDGTPILEVFKAAASSDDNSGSWTNASNMRDGNEDTFAANVAAPTVFAYQSSYDYYQVVGAEITLEASDGLYNLLFGVSYFRENLATSFAFGYLPLNDIKGNGKVRVRVTVPPARVAVGQVANFASAYFKAAATTGNLTAGAVKIYEFKLLVGDRTLLSQIAKSNIKLPAREVTEITCARRITRTVNGEVQELTKPFLLTELGKYVAIRGVPTPDGKTITVTNEIKEIVDTYSTKEDMFSRIGAGGKIRSPEVMAISNAIRRATDTGG